MEIIYKHEASRNMSPDYFRIHTHTCCEIFYLIKGSGFFVVEGHKYPISPNCLVLLRPGEMHRAEIASGGEYERAFLHFPEELLWQLDRSGGLLRPFNDRLIGQKNFYEPGRTDTGFIWSVLQKCGRFLEETPDDRAPLLHGLYLIMREIAARFEQKHWIDVRPGYDQEIYEIIQYINQNLCSEQSLNELEKRFFISRPVLNKRFKNATGTTVWNYIITKRVVLADQMIAEGESATQAAFACGYNDYSSFYRAYRRVFNRSPRKKPSGESEEKADKGEKRPE